MNIKLFQNKFFIIAIIISVSVFLFSARIAQAGTGGILTALSIVATAVVAVYAPYVLFGTSSLLNTLTVGSSLITGAMDAVNITYTIGLGTVLTAGGVTTAAVACLEDLICPGGSAGGTIMAIVPTEQTDCTFQLRPKFYIPKMNVSYGYYHDETDEYGNTTTVLSCNMQDPGFNETSRQIAVYRLTIPSNVDQGTYNDWFINQVKNQVGNGFIDIDGPGAGDSYNFPPDDGYYRSSGEVAPVKVLSYSTNCSGNVCEFPDVSVPENSYVVYLAKILGDYGGVAPAEWGLCTYVNPNKFLNTDNTDYVKFPTIYATGYFEEGNAIFGPFKTASCLASGAPPAAPANVSASLVSCNQVQISWQDNSDSEDSYTIERCQEQYSGYCADADAAWPEVGTVGTNVATFSDSGAAGSTAYAYRVRAQNSNGISRNDPAANPYITTSICVPGAATLISPNGTINTKTPTHIWNAVPGSTQYRLLVNDATRSPKIDIWYGAAQVGCPSGTGQCSVGTYGGALADGAADWKIQTYNTGGYGPWSAQMNFTVVSKTLNVSLTANPKTGSVPLNTNLRADVSGSAVGTINYSFWWNCSNSGTNVAAVSAVCGALPSPAPGNCDTNSYGTKCEAINSTTRTVSHTYNSPDTYYPKVIVERDTGVPSATNSTLSVTVANQLPSASQLRITGWPATYCLNGPSPMFTFEWRYSDNPENHSEKRYQFQIDDKSNFSDCDDNNPATRCDVDYSSGDLNPMLNSPSTNTQTARVVSSPSPGTNEIGYNTRYYWRARVFDQYGGDSGWIKYSQASDPDQNGRADSFNTTAHSWPSPSFSFKPASPSAMELVNFINSSVCYGIGGTAPCTWNWAIPNSNISSPPNQRNAFEPSIRFNSEGINSATLQAIDGDNYSCAYTVNNINVKPPLPEWREGR